MLQWKFEVFHWLSLGVRLWRLSGPSWAKLADIAKITVVTSRLGTHRCDYIGYRTDLHAVNFLLVTIVTVT